MKENKLFTLLLLLLVIWIPAKAQTPSIDIVTMKDGKTWSGKIMQYSPGSILRIELADGTIVEVSDGEITKIQQGVELPKEEIKRQDHQTPEASPKAKTRGFYATSMLSFAGGDSNSEGISLGAGFSQVFGFHLNQHLGIGGGFGIDNYSRRGETVYPLFGEVRSFLPSKKSTGNFYLLAAGGYAFGFPRKRLDITDSKGGVVGYAALGYRAVSAEGLDINVDIGPKFQRAHFERKLYNGDVEVRDIDFKRIVIRVGIGFWK
ncbi:MAG: hypothetical protein K9J37_08535 [Saprospiraceae bacterium]|nr:hypothetical protein [Saprospiraceae bacterium]MCF8249946.1 hypothetical protein [Saprospiraceae bacterium]MCF8279359.1 hypothetical protein [Bacteroidales bacterium]MCF8310050.1 hypothetical protein [Saprospiraceae bacterium]MCF8438950.1 hypothetical protein [Saprospiraceae bacterium]